MMYLTRLFFRTSRRQYLNYNHATFHTTSRMPANAKSKFSHLPLSTSGPIECAVTGTVLLNTPYFNRGSAHSAEERREFNLTGLIPPGIQTLEQQVERAYQQYTSRHDDLAKNTFLTSLKEQNLVLYFKVRPCRLCYITWFSLDAIFVVTDLIYLTHRTPFRVRVTPY